MIKNSLMKFIDSCVGNIARKIEDEFNESDHPRDKGGRFASKGGEGRGGAGKADKPQVEETDFEKEAKEELNGKKGNVVTTSMAFTGDEEDAKQLAKKYGFDYKLKYPKGSPYATIELTGDKDALRKYAINEGFGSEEDAREFVPELFEESEDDQDEHSDEYEEGTSTTNLYGDKMYAPAVINALQHYYNGDSKKVGNIIRHINSITSNLEVWGEYPVREIVNDIEDRYGELDQHTKDNIAVYLSKTAPSYWDPEVEYWKEKNKKHPGPKELAFYE